MPLPCMLKALLLMLAMAAPVSAGGSEAVLAAVNSVRAKAGCPALAMNARLVAAAKGHADAMAEQNFFAHAGKDGSRFSGRINQQGYRFSAAAENIAAGQSSAAEVMQSWLDSAGHRRNILDCGFRDTGIAVVYHPDDKPLRGTRFALRYYWVQVFAAP